MENYREFFIEYLKKQGLHTPQIEAAFEMYSTELQLANQFVNLFSRQMRVEEIWGKHFIDSVSIFEVYNDFAGKRILDFGTGGGVPGIPIKIIQPDCSFILLDSTKKKIETLRNIVQDLKLTNVECLAERIEDREMDAYNGTFDIIVSRGVRITPTFNDAFKRLLKPDGKVLLYKANINENTMSDKPTKPAKKERKYITTSTTIQHSRRRLVEDLSFLKNIKIHKLALDILGERKIIEINYE